MNRALRTGIAVVALLTAAGVLAPLLVSGELLSDPLALDLEQSLRPPDRRHWLGTDEYGRDVLSRLLHGARTALLVAGIATAVSLALGVPAGALAGLRGGVWDLALTRLMEATAALPALPLMLLIVAFSTGKEGGGGPDATILLACAIGVTRWAVIARYVRGGVFKVREEEYALAAVALGADRARLLSRHLLPGALTPALVSAAFAAGSAVLMESALSFLGLGSQPPAPSWGLMVAAALAEHRAWWLLLAPGAAIAALVMGFNALAEGIRLRGAAPPRPAEHPASAEA